MDRRFDSPCQGSFWWHYQYICIYVNLSELTCSRDVGWLVDPQIMGGYNY